MKEDKLEEIVVDSVDHELAVMIRSFERMSQVLPPESVMEAIRTLRDALSPEAVEFIDGDEVTAAVDQAFFIAQSVLDLLKKKGLEGLFVSGFKEGREP